MFLGGLGFFLQNFQLRIGTYYYVHKMVNFDLLLMDPNRTLHPEFYTYPIQPSFGETPQDVSYGSLEDTVSSVLGYQHVDIKFLDMLAALFPFFFLVMACSMDLPRTWTRICVSFFFLAIGKGFFAWCTTVPDSNGWQVCKKRLGNSTNPVEWYAQERTLMEILLMSPLSRLCADMMWSGHTYFVAIFAFGLHECVHRALSERNWCVRVLCETIVGVAAVAQQAIEIYFVLRSHFHYTSDVVMAVFVTYLLYTNSTIAIFANWWVRPSHVSSMDMALVLLDREDPDDPDEEDFRDNRWLFNGMEAQGEVSLGCCCCFGESHYLYSGTDVKKIMNDIGLLSKEAEYRGNNDAAMQHILFDKPVRDLLLESMNLLTTDDENDEDWPSKHKDS